MKGWVKIMSFSEKLKQAMKEKNMSQADLSALTGIGKSSISQYLSGKNEPKSKAVEKIAEAMQINTAWFTGQEQSNLNSSKQIEKCISIEKAAELLGKSKQFIRHGLQDRIFPFGYAVKLSSRWTYHISPKQFYEYTGQQ
jgi:transcriptional regulator with XRE-family HTH domain